MKVSPELEKVREKYIVEPVKVADRRNYPDVLFGIDYKDVWNQVIEKGRADFTRESHGLTIEEKVLLYAYFNMLGHIKRGINIFSEEHNKLESILESGLLIYDIGCGPFTTCLAFADSFENKVFDYIGVDNSRGMLNLGYELWNGFNKIKSTTRNQCSPKSFLNWKQINPGEETKGRNTLINFSFFFASKQLNDEAINSLVSFVKNVIKATPNETLLLNVNSNYEKANIWFKEFAEKLGIKSNPINLGDNAIYDFITLNIGEGKAEKRQEKAAEKRKLEAAGKHKLKSVEAHDSKDSLSTNIERSQPTDQWKKENLSKKSKRKPEEDIWGNIPVDHDKLLKGIKNRRLKGKTEKVSVNAAEEARKQEVAEKQRQREADEKLKKEAKEKELQLFAKNLEKQRKQEVAEKQRQREADEKRIQAGKEYLKRKSLEDSKKKKKRKKRFLAAITLSIFTVSLTIAYFYKYEEENQSPPTKEQAYKSLIDSLPKNQSSPTKEQAYKSLIDSLPKNQPHDKVEMANNASVVTKIELTKKPGKITKSKKEQSNLFLSFSPKSKKLEKIEIENDAPKVYNYEPSIRPKDLWYEIDSPKQENFPSLDQKHDEIKKKISVPHFQYSAEIYGYVSDHSNIITLKVADTNLEKDIHFEIWDFRKRKILALAKTDTVQRGGLNAIITKRKVDLKLHKLVVIKTLESTLPP